ncbi:hypothetical protein M434DRAFT_399089 [Hypoxylon sp. CO27-5]|nr:hypothetical protein M434DRAFT_399089 [Hypoxylon sp. CO27-5]
MSHLPNEILMNIFSCLRISLTTQTFEYGRNLPFINLSTLASLCRASKRFQGLAQPLLYHTVPRQYNDTNARLLQTLSRCPHLAEMVRSIDLEASEIPPPVLHESFEVARDRLNLPSSDIESELEDALDSEESGADVVLILSLLPNLELLEYTCRYGEYDLILRFLNEVAYSLIPGTPETDSGEVAPLSRLGEVRLRHWDTEYTTSIFAVEEFLLPTLHTLRGWSISWNEPRGTLEGLQTRLNLKHIYLDSTLCNAEGFKDLLSRCPDLQTLRIGWGSATVGDDSELDFQQIGVALRNHAHNLEEFTPDQVKKIRQRANKHDFSKFIMLRPTYTIF